MMRIFIILLLCFSSITFNKISARSDPIPQKDEDKILQQKKIVDKIKKNLKFKTEWPENCESLSVEPFIQTSKNDEFLFCGIMNGKNLTDFFKLTEKTPNIKILRVKSAGGTHVGAFYTGDLFQQKNFSLIIDGICLSACVDFSLAFNNVVISKNTIFAADYNYISTINYIVDVAIKLDILVQIENSKVFKEYVLGSYFYLANQFSKRLTRHSMFQEIMAPMEVKCMGEIKDNDLVFYDYKIYFESKYDLWVVPPKYINLLRERFGLVPIEFAYMDKDNTSKFVKKYSEKYKIRTVTYDEIFEIYERDKNKTPQFCSIE